MQGPTKLTEKELVLIGGGHAHVSVIKQFAMRPMPGIRLTVISRDLLAPYSGMLPGYIAGHYSLEQCHIDLTPLVKFANGRFIHAEVNHIDVENRLIHCFNRAPIYYDVTSINIGSAPNLGALDKNAVVPVKPISHFVDRWQHLQSRVLNSDGELHIAVVGAGAGGVELCLAMQYRLQHELAKQNKNNLRLHFHLFDNNSEVLSSHNRRVREKFSQLLNRRDISVHLNKRVSSVSDAQITTASGEQFPANEVLWVTRASAQTWLSNTLLELSPDGFISVDASLQSVSHPNVFAAGDIANVIAHPRPKAGVFAVRQGLPLSRNLYRALKSKPLRNYEPQTEFLSLISTGDKQAIASRGQWMLSGKLMWLWKDWIDRRFMDRFNSVPAQKYSERSNQKYHKASLKEFSQFATPPMYCGGCGSKVGQQVLKGALQNLSGRSREDIVQGLDHPDDAAIVKQRDGQLHVHSVDHFCAFIDDPFLFGKICAEHALSDVYAMGAIPSTALAITTLPRLAEALQKEDLKQLLLGAREALDQGEVELIGGHTNSGDTMALGFAINGTVEPDNILSKRGLCIGDKLILTKGIGTGTIFAAHMRNQAKGKWIENALTSMLLSNRNAAAILQTHFANACTDVTGFGLLGHLLEMLDTASNAVINVSINSLPIVGGAEESLALDIVSSAQAQNQHQGKRIVNITDYVHHANYPLLFDPQTSGGLVASVPANQAHACVKALRDSGYVQATIIGEVVAAQEGVAPISLKEGSNE